MSESSQPWVSMNDIFAAEETKLRKEREERETQKAKQDNSEKSAIPAQAVEESKDPSPTIPNQYHPQPIPEEIPERTALDKTSVVKQPPVASSSPPTIAPQRDFNRRANSLERDALPSGLFPGSSKKLYDAVYARTRGAVTPRLEIQATKRDLMIWSGIRNIKTIETHVRHLVTVGLMTRRGENGDSAGFHYGVRLPEEINPTPSPSPTIPNQHGAPPPGPNPRPKNGDGEGPKNGNGWGGSNY